MTPCLLLSLRFPTLEHTCAGGEALLPEEQEQWRRQTGVLLYQVYGQSETVSGWSLPGQAGCAQPRSPSDGLNHTTSVCRGPTALMEACGRLQGSRLICPKLICGETIHSSSICQETNVLKTIGEKLKKGSKDLVPQSL